jgi:hypothetical protein
MPASCSHNEGNDLGRHRLDLLSDLLSDLLFIPIRNVLIAPETTSHHPFLGSTLCHLFLSLHRSRSSFSLIFGLFLWSSFRPHGLGRSPTTGVSSTFSSRDLLSSLFPDLHRYQSVYKTDRLPIA